MSYRAFKRLLGESSLECLLAVDGRCSEQSFGGDDTAFAHAAGTERQLTGDILVGVILEHRRREKRNDCANEDEYGD